jgi:KUP system potassium uptake protein
MPYSTTSVLNSDTGFAGEAHNRLEQSPSLATVLVALGIVYGYLGTSPLYALQTIVHIVGHEFTPEEALGSLSLVVWSLIITISVKYSVFVMRGQPWRGWYPCAHGYDRRGLVRTAALAGHLRIIWGGPHLW